MIKVLDADTANKIAAGEVVERPSSVVKELVENSLDAGSCEISVEILKGGMSFIRVRDNGRGISKDQLRLALSRHATSKIGRAEDLEYVTTLGFRGEALPSIAAVANFSISSAVLDKPGYELEVFGGKAAEIIPKAMSKGTIVEVSDLFYNVPARRKFVGSENAEAGRIQRYLEAVAISRPDVEFVFVKDGKTIVQTQKVADQLLTIRSVYGEKIASGLLKVAGEIGDYKIGGYVGKPDIARGRRDLQIFIINRRLVECKTVQVALEKVFYDVIPKRRYPIAFLNIQIPPTDIDVNVHPAKLLVRLAGERQVFSLVHNSVKGAVDERLLEPGSFMEPYGTKQKRHLDPAQDQKTFTFVTKSDQPFDADKKVYDLSQRDLDISILRDESLATKEEKPVGQEAFREIRNFPRILGQANQTFIIVEWEDGIILYDQHSAHERVLYEKYTDRALKPTQTELLFPLPLSLSPDEYSALERLKERLEDLGFAFCEFGPASYAITHVPTDVNGSEAEEIVKELLLEKLGPDFRQKAAAILACKGAVKAGLRLDSKQMLILIQNLHHCKKPSLCPHGRPTMLKLDWNEMEKRFGRNR